LVLTVATGPLCPGMQGDRGKQRRRLELKAEALAKARDPDYRR
jgi:hypothetical protein